MSITINADLPERIVQSLEKVSQETKKSKSYLMKKAIENYILEYKDLNLALNRLIDNKDQLVTLADLRSSLGL